MDTSKIIKGAVSSGRYTVTAPIVKEDYGLYLQIEGIELPSTYEVDFSNSEHSGTSVTMIGNSDGVLIPHQFIDTGKDVFAFLYHVGANYGRTVYKFRIPNKVRPDRTNEEPTPEEQSTIDQAITALNSAVAQTARDVIDADASAQSAQGYAEQAETARDTAQGYASNAQLSATQANNSAISANQSASASAQSASQSAQIKADVEDLADDAQGYAQASAQSASVSANSASQAQGFAQSASASANSASGYASQADISANTASNKASEASGYASTASQKATEASQSASQALSYKTDAESAKTASQTAQGLAESARDTAVSAKTDAESAKADAESARDEAQQAVASISGALDDKAPVITDTASGSIASFSDGADGLPLKSLVVDINPVQDLHGQDSPYPAGGGTNILNPENLADGTYITLNSDESVTIQSTNGKAWSSVNVVPLKAGTYTVKIFGLTAGYSQVRTSEDNYASNVTFNYNESATITLTSDGGIKFKIGINATSYPIKAYPIMVNGNTVPAKWSPYENLCPISGWTRVNVEQRGVNVWDEEWELGYINPSNGNNASSSNCIRAKNYIAVEPNTTYYVVCPNVSGVNVKIATYNADKGFISPLMTKANGTVTTPSDCHYIRFFMSDPYGTTYNHDISINYPSTDHSYHPYTGRSITINLGQTVYGGKLDVLSGKLVIDRAMVDLGTLTWAVYNEQRRIYRATLADGVPYTDNTKIPNILTEQYQTVNGNTTWANGMLSMYASSTDSVIVICDTNYADASAFTSAVSGQKLVYELATPIEIQLSANQINSLYGVNNLWADSGDTEVEYRADTKLFIERLTAPDSADMIADANIQSGKYFMVGNSLYLATANIANGSAIVVGTNCIRKSLSEALNEINA